MTNPPLVPQRHNYLGSYLRKLRIDNGRSTSWIAKKLGYSVSHIYHVESGRAVLRDKKVLASWVKYLTDGKTKPNVAYKLAMVTYPEMFLRVGRLSIDDRLRMLALIQEIHLRGMPERVAKAIDRSIIEPNGTVVRMKDNGTNIPVMDKRPVVQQKITYEDFYIDPKVLEVSDAGSSPNSKFLDFLKSPGKEVQGMEPVIKNGKLH